MCYIVFIIIYFCVAYDELGYGRYIVCNLLADAAVVVIWMPNTERVSFYEYGG